MSVNQYFLLRALDYLAGLQHVGIQSTRLAIALVLFWIGGLVTVRIFTYYV